ncbi:MAG TPA: hypothetical protein VLA36_06390 [Longimicrobiales bacterium]|nr:hypothetical protein [Longimicrobiales bacterium]
MAIDRRDFLRVAYAGAGLASAGTPSLSAENRRAPLISQLLSRPHGSPAPHPHEDPDTSIRWIAEDDHARPGEILAKYSPALPAQPFNETRACHYESSVDSNFIIGQHPGYDNAWLAGGGSAEAFKQGPVLGEYIAGRVLDTENDAELAESFRLKDGQFEEDERRE